MAEKLTADKLAPYLMKIADELRGSMDATEYRDYILSFIFYRYLSHKQEEYITNNGILFVEDGENVNDAYAQLVKDEDLKTVHDAIATELGYVIDPEYTWETIVEKVKNQTIRPDDFQMMFSTFNRNASLNPHAEQDFKNIFDRLNLQNPSLGNSVADQARSLAKLVSQLNEVEFFDEDGHDILGDTYEYLIAQFAGRSGKKAGEFYTPHEVSRVLARIVTLGQENSHGKNFSVYDPTMGSGSLLLTVQQELKNTGSQESVHFYGQEFNQTTFNLARMNLMMHDVEYGYMTLRCADTLESDWPEGTDSNGVDHPLFFDAVVANPPYSQNWDNQESKLKDPRFKDYGKLAPKSKADFAFLTHSLYHLNQTGTMAIVLPHGVLFRGAAEGVIRKALIDKNYLDAVIGLPANLFYSTSIPTTILVFKKNRTNNDILFIDASEHFEKNKNQNKLRDEDIDLIIETYKNRVDVDKLAHVASLEEIKGNDYNLNIPRYVNTFEEEEPIDLDEVNHEIAETDAEIARLEAEFEAMAAQLVRTEENND